MQNHEISHLVYLVSFVFNGFSKTDAHLRDA